MEVPRGCPRDGPRLKSQEQVPGTSHRNKSSHRSKSQEQVPGAGHRSKSKQWFHAKWKGHIAGQGVYKENVCQMLALGGSMDTVEKEEADISEEGETKDPDGSETEHIKCYKMI